MDILVFDDLRRAFKRGQRVLDGVTFAVEPGEVVGLLGKNGSGKTTLLNLAMGMLEPQAGEVRVFGLDPREVPVEVKQRVGFVPEDQVLPPFLTVAQVLAMHRNLFPAWDQKMERELVDRFEMPLGTRIKKLSKGQARQVALTCAIAHRPELLLLDEPAGGLDPAARREFLEASIAYLNETGSTILFSSHHMSDVERIARRIVMLHDGEVFLDDDLDDLREEFSLAIIPKDSGVSLERVRGVDGCLAARSRFDAIHAVLRTPPSMCERRLHAELGTDGIRCQSIPLEEMFVELMGGSR